MNTSTYFNLALQMIQRNNPVFDVINRATSLLYFLMNYKSNIKLNNYRKNLYVQQLKRMEGFISQGSPYRYNGGKMDRRF